MNEKELTYSALRERLDALTEQYDIMSYSYIGESTMGRGIPIVTLGDEKARGGVLYASTHHASENICTSVMMRFIEEYLSAYERYGQVCQINTRYLYKMRKIYIIPMLNPDGVEYRLNGIEKTNPLRERIIACNEGEDFSCWNANARGVDLNHNYNAKFIEYKKLEKERQIKAGRTKYSGEYPESESEVSSLCNFIRYHLEDINGVLTLHTQGEEIYYSHDGKIPEKSRHIIGIISRMTGYTPSFADDTASYGGLTDWLISEFNKPSFTLECGKGENPLPISQLPSIYSRVRELLFTFPILF